MNSRQYTFSDFTKKTVINVCDGRELGHVCDLIFNNYGNIVAVVVPGKKSLFKSLTSAENLIIPFNRIVKIGSDVILTDVVGNMATACAAPPKSAPAYTQQAPPQGYQKPYADAYAPPEYSAQAYSMPAEPMYSSEADAQYASPKPAPPSPQVDASPASAQTYYHAE